MPLPEVTDIEHLLEAGAGWLTGRTEGHIDVGAERIPLHVITLGNPDPAVPGVGFFGGVHGLERIGAEVVIAYLRSLVARLSWDSVLHHQLQSMRLVFMPMVNPGGAWRGTRANLNGVDLMRNAPVEAVEKVPFLMGGHRRGPGWPWYRGAAGNAMESENLAVCRVVETELLNRRFSMAIDCHSGFGLRDRIWFPYAHTKKPIPHLAEVAAFKQIFDQTYSNHSYVLEPQSAQYLTHGDLWDHLYRIASEQPEKIFLPLTLEMGSWAWIRKNPKQLFSRLGIFNPLIEHRRQRVLRRHLTFLDFVTVAACSAAHWLPVGSARLACEERALADWYETDKDS